MSWKTKSSISVRDPNTGELREISWDEVQRFEENLRRTGKRLPKDEWQRFQELKSRFPEHRQKQARQKQVSRMNKGITSVEQGAKTFSKGFHKRVIQGGSQHVKTGYWRGGTYYPYQRRYKQKRKSQKRFYDRYGREMVIVNGKAYPVAGTGNRQGRYPRQSGNYRRRPYNRRKKRKWPEEDEDQEINGFFNLFG